MQIRQKKNKKRITETHQAIQSLCDAIEKPLSIPDFINQKYGEELGDVTQLSESKQQEIFEEYSEAQLASYVDKGLTILSSVLRCPFIVLETIELVENTVLHYAILLGKGNCKTLDATLNVTNHAHYNFLYDQRELKIEFHSLSATQIDEVVTTYNQFYPALGAKRKNDAILFNLIPFLKFVVHDMAQHEKLQNLLEAWRLSREFSPLWNPNQGTLTNITELFTLKKSPFSPFSIFHLTPEEKEAKKIVEEIKDGSELKVYRCLLQHQQDPSLSKNMRDRVTFALQQLKHVEPLYARKYGASTSSTSSTSSTTSLSLRSC